MRVAAAFLLALAGCPGGGERADGGPGGSAELGTGSVAFEPIVPEQDLGLVAGPQGGHHFIVHARARGIAPGDPSRPGQPQNPSTTFSAFAEDGTQIDVMNPPYRLGYEDEDGDGWLELPSGRILQIEEVYVPGLVGRRVRVRVDIVDEDGVTAADERWVVCQPWEVVHPPDAGPTSDSGPGGR